MNKRWTRKEKKEESRCSLHFFLGRIFHEKIKRDRLESDTLFFSQKVDGDDFSLLKNCLAFFTLRVELV